MEKFLQLKAVAAPLLRANIDTDAIIPSREMKGVGKDGLSAGLFANWRYTDPVKRIENPDFVLNQEPYRGARILLARGNFGCGSSREHAVWALAEYGVRAVIAPSFGAIFYNNCVRNGILPVVLEEPLVNELAAQVQAAPRTNLLDVDLPAQRVMTPRGEAYPFAISAGDKSILMGGLDSIDITLQNRAEIDGFETRDRSMRPWAYLTG